MNRIFHRTNTQRQPTAAQSRPTRENFQHQRRHAAQHSAGPHSRWDQRRADSAGPHRCHPPPDQDSARPHRCHPPPDQDSARPNRCHPRRNHHSSRRHRSHPRRHRSHPRQQSSVKPRTTRRGQLRHDVPPATATTARVERTARLPTGRRRRPPRVKPRRPNTLWGQHPRPRLPFHHAPWLNEAPQRRTGANWSPGELSSLRSGHSIAASRPIVPPGLRRGCAAPFDGQGRRV